MERNVLRMSDSFGKRLQAARKAKGLTQQELADKAGVGGFPRISTWENDRALPDLDNVIKLLRALDPLSCAYLLLGEGPLWRIDDEHVTRLYEWLDDMPPFHRSPPDDDEEPPGEDAN
jgi:transcriptional regulator with XRE-family HTH domain